MKEYQNLSLYRTPKNFRGKSKVMVQLWWVIDALLFKPSPQIMYGWRRFLLKLFGAKIGKNVILRSSVRVTYPWKLTIDENSWVGDDVILYTLGEIEIGKNTVISQRSYLCTGSHNYTKKEFPIYSKKIIVEDSCWLATDVFVAPGITIGKGTIVGSRSSVYNDLPAGKVCVGSPARIIKERPSNQ